MKTPRKNKRLTKAQLLLQDPQIASYLAKNKELQNVTDANALVRLLSLFTGRVMPLVRHPLGRRCGVRRDPRNVAYRFLKRSRGGEWFRGGSHVARLHFGPGIAFPNWVNDRAVPVIPELLNLCLQAA
jgi:hypothetical protein